MFNGDKGRLLGLGVGVVLMSIGIAIGSWLTPCDDRPINALIIDGDAMIVEIDTVLITESHGRPLLIHNDSGVIAIQYAYYGLDIVLGYTSSADSLDAASAAVDSIIFGIYDTYFECPLCGEYRVKAFPNMSHKRNSCCPLCGKFYEEWPLIVGRYVFDSMGDTVAFERRDEQ